MIAGPLFSEQNKTCVRIPYPPYLSSFRAHQYTHTLAQLPVSYTHQNTHTHLQRAGGDELLKLPLCVVKEAAGLVTDLLVVEDLGVAAVGVLATELPNLVCWVCVRACE